MKLSVSDFNEIDRWIREGRAREASARIYELAHRKLPREHTLNLARLARRANLAELSVQMLNPIVRPSARAKLTPTAEEVSEYASSLTRIGAPEEALEILDDLDPVALPQVYLYRAFALVAEWRYAETIGPLCGYLAAKEITDYQRIVAEINLAAAYVYELQWEQADRLLARLRESTKKEGHLLLYGNALRISAEMYLGLGDWEACEHSLQLAEGIFRANEDLNHLFIQKFRVMLALKRKGYGSAEALALGEVIAKAQRAQHWETLRDLDRARATYARDEALLRRVFFGTPFQAFREMLVRDYSRPISMPEVFHWEPIPRKARFELDLLRAHVNSPGVTLRRGELIHRFLAILASDFYKPFRLAPLFSRLYPGEYFHPHSSTLRIHQAVYRTRAWLKNNGVPIEIRERDGSYGLHFLEPCVLVVSKNGVKGTEERIDDLRRKFSSNAFTSQQAAKCLGISERSAVRVLRTECERGNLVRTGWGTSCQYCFPTFATSKTA